MSRLKISYIIKPYAYFLVITMLLLAVSANRIYAQEEGATTEAPKKETQQDKNSGQQDKTARVVLEKSDAIAFDQNRLPDVQIIKGNVRFRHEDALMYCDSAYFYSKASSFDAFGNVRIIEGDSIFIYGDMLFYDGNTRLARMRENVRMENNGAELITDSLNYNREYDLAYYFTGGTLRDNRNTLTSIWGQYSPTTKQALFRDSVKLVNESFTMVADTLKYNTENKIADIVGETHINYLNETDIYSTRGWYDTNMEKSMLLDRSLIVHENGKTVTGDTIYYNKLEQYVEGFMNMELADSTQQVTLYGDYIFYNELTEDGLATDSALIVDWSSTDSLYTHADTLKIFKDSVYDVMQAYPNVRFFRSDMQGVCDSLIYLSKDSIATMYGQPVVWSGNSQLSGEVIKAFIKGESVDRIYIPRKALGVQPSEYNNFNQFSSKELTAYIIDGALNRVVLSGNVETIYFIIDDVDMSLVGINKTSSSYATMYFKDQEMDRLVLTDADSNGTTYPVEELTGEQRFLSGFFWLEEQQPKSKMDVFLTFPNKNRHESNVNHIRSAASPDTPENTQTKEESK